MNYQDILGWMTTGDLKAITEISSSVGENNIIVEVGSMFGRSAACWATHVPTTVDIYCIDSWYESYIQQHSISESDCLTNRFPLSGKEYNLLEEFKNNTKEFSNIRMIRGLCPTHTPWTELPIDVFFLDASHSNPNDWEILEYFIPFVKNSGIICGHDYDANQFPDVVENVKKLELMFGVEPVLFENSSIWMITKNV